MPQLLKIDLLISLAAFVFWFGRALWSVWPLTEPQPYKTVLMAATASVACAVFWFISLPITFSLWWLDHDLPTPVSALCRLLGVG